MLTVVDGDDGADHFRNDNHVTQMRLDRWRLFTVRSTLLGDAQLLQNGVRATGDTAGEFTALASRKQFHEVVDGHVQQLVEVHAAVRKLLTETALLLLFFTGRSAHPGGRS